MARTKRNKRNQPGDDNVSKQHVNRNETLDPVSQVANWEEQIRVDEMVMKDLMERRASITEQIEATR